jgi:uncharacterized membrane protein (GlpM family)
MDLKLIPLYFIIGGLTVALTVYFGSRGSGVLAAFINLFPAVTVISFIAIYIHGGTQALTSYTRGMVLLLPAWIIYLVGMYFLVPRIGLLFSLLIGIALFIAVSFLIARYT